MLNLAKCTPSTPQQHAFLRTAAKDALEALWVLALNTGMRQGELLGLRWSNIKSDHLMILRRLDQRTKKSASTKTADSVRRIDVDAVTANHLVRHKQRMRKSGQHVGDHDLVFTNTAGKPLSASNLTSRRFKPMLVDSGLPTSIRFHDLRHSHATLLLSYGINPKVVQERLGHGSVRTTLDLYGHALPSSQRHAAVVAGKLLYGKKSLSIPLTTRSKVKRNPAKR